MKKTLKNAKEIAKYLLSTETPRYTPDTEWNTKSYLHDWEETFKGCKATLKTVNVSELRYGLLIMNLDQESVDKYKLLSVKTIPPLVVRGNKVIEGNHRLRVLKLSKTKTVRVYVVEELT